MRQKPVFWYRFWRRFLASVSLALWQYDWVCRTTAGGDDSYADDENYNASTTSATVAATVAATAAAGSRRAVDVAAADVCQSAAAVGR